MPTPFLLNTIVVLSVFGACIQQLGARRMVKTFESDDEDMIPVSYQQHGFGVGQRVQCRDESTKESAKQSVNDMYLLEEGINGFGGHNEWAYGVVTETEPKLKVLIDTHGHPQEFDVCRTPPKGEPGVHYVFYELLGTDLFYHSQLLVCESSAMPLDVRKVLDRKEGVLRREREINPYNVSGSEEVMDQELWKTVKGKHCVRLAYGPAGSDAKPAEAKKACSGLWPTKAHLEDATDAALEWGGIPMRRLYKYFYGTTRRSGVDAYKRACGMDGYPGLCQGQYAGAAYSPLTHNCNWGTSHMLGCYFRLNSRRPASLADLPIVGNLLTMGVGAIGDWVPGFGQGWWTMAGNCKCGPVEDGEDWRADGS